MSETDDIPVLIYDGHCAFCRREASRLQRWVGGRLRLESFRDAGVLDRYSSLTASACEEAVQLVEPDGRIWSGAAAFARALRLRSLLAPLGAIYWIPGVRWLADRAYRWVARNRFRLPGADGDIGGCRAHPADRRSTGGD